MRSNGYTYGLLIISGLLMVACGPMTDTDAYELAGSGNGRTSGTSNPAAPNASANPAPTAEQRERAADAYFASVERSQPRTEPQLRMEPQLQMEPQTQTPRRWFWPFGGRSSGDDTFALANLPPIGLDQNGLNYVEQQAWRDGSISTRKHLGMIGQKRLELIAEGERIGFVDIASKLVTMQMDDPSAVDSWTRTKLIQSMEDALDEHIRETLRDHGVLSHDGTVYWVPLDDGRKEEFVLADSLDLLPGHLDVLRDHRENLQASLPFETNLTGAQQSQVEETASVADLTRMEQTAQRNREELAYLKSQNDILPHALGLTPDEREEARILTDVFTVEDLDPAKEASRVDAARDHQQQRLYYADARMRVEDLEALAVWRDEIDELGSERLSRAIRDIDTNRRREDVENDLLAMVADELVSALGEDADFEYARKSTVWGNGDKREEKYSIRLPEEVAGADDWARRWYEFTLPMDPNRLAFGADQARYETLRKITGRLELVYIFAKEQSPW